MSSKTPHIDHKYIIALREGDNRLIREIYERFSKKIIAYIVKNNGSESDAQDMIQEGLITIARQAQKEDFILTCPFEPYLLMVCRGKWFNRLKKNKREVVTDSFDFGFSDNEDPQILAERTEADDLKNRLFKTHFAQLSEGCQELIKLSLTLNNMGAVAEKMSVSYAYARKRKSQCMKTLVSKVRSAADFKLLHL